jgi:hypothetical protein
MGQLRALAADLTFVSIEEGFNRPAGIKLDLSGNEFTTRIL